MNNKIVDIIAMKQIEKELSYKFSYSEIDAAKNNEGEITIKIKGRSYYIILPVIDFDELMNELYEK